MSLATVQRTSKGARWVSGLASGESAERWREQQQNSGKEGTTTLSGTKVRGKFRANSRNQQAGETWYDARHLGDGGPNPNTAWSNRVSVSLVNRACHLRVRVGGSCRAGLETGLVVPVTVTEGVRARKFLVKAPQAACKSERCGGFASAPESGFCPWRRSKRCIEIFSCEAGKR